MTALKQAFNFREWQTSQHRSSDHIAREIKRPYRSIFFLVICVFDSKQYNFDMEVHMAMASAHGNGNFCIIKRSMS